MFTRTMLLSLLLTLSGCAKLLGQEDSDPKVAQCVWADTGTHDFGDGVSRKSELWACLDYDGKQCYEITYPADPVTYRSTTCEGQTQRN